MMDPGCRELATQLSLVGEWLQVRRMNEDCLSVVCHYYILGISKNKDAVRTYLFLRPISYQWTIDSDENSWVLSPRPRINLNFAPLIKPSNKFLGTFLLLNKNALKK